MKALDRPKVSVSIITYNHAKYISQALDGVLIQKANFDYEILIGEDDSSDGTREIVKDYRARYPDRIRLFLNDRKNVIYLGGKPTGVWNFLNNLSHVKGDYIALLEGDDYWIDPLKLQKQVDFLEGHSEYSFCFHDVIVENENGEQNSSELLYKTEKINYDISDLLKSNFIQTCSVVYRRTALPVIPDWFCRTPISDWPLFIILAQQGKIHRLTEKMAAYRVHAGGIWGLKAAKFKYQNTILTAKVMRKQLGTDVEKDLNRTITVLSIELARDAYKNHQLSFLRYLVDACFYDFAFTRQVVISGIKLRLNKIGRE